MFWCLVNILGMLKDWLKFSESTRTGFQTSLFDEKVCKFHSLNFQSFVKSKNLLGRVDCLSMAVC